MLAGGTGSFGVAVVWLGVCVAAFLLVDRWVEAEPRAHPALVIAGAAAVARFVPALTLDRGLFFDISAHQVVGTLALAGRDVYTAPAALNRYPYPPLHMYISALMVWLSGHDAARFLYVDKLIPAACGVGVAVVVWAAARRLGLGPRAALRCGLLYAVNPLPVLVSSYHGQFEEIPLLCLALALLLLLDDRQRAGTVALSALLCGVAIAYKSWPVLFLPALGMAARGWWRRLLYAALAALPLAASLALYGLAFGRAGLSGALHNMLGYRGPTDFCWGYVAVLRGCWITDQRLQPNAWVLPASSVALLAGLLVVGVLLLWRRRPLEGLVAAPLVFYLFSPGWGPNYSVWVLPFLVLAERSAGGTLATRYTLLVLPNIALSYIDTLYVAYSYYHFSYHVLKPILAVLGLCAWAGIAALLLQLYRARAAPSAAPVTRSVVDVAVEHERRGLRGERAAPG